MKVRKLKPGELVKFKDGGYGIRLNDTDSDKNKDKVERLTTEFNILAGYLRGECARAADKYCRDGDFNMLAKTYNMMVIKTDLLLSNVKTTADIVGVSIAKVSNRLSTDGEGYEPDDFFVNVTAGIQKSMTKEMVEVNRVLDSGDIQKAISILYSICETIKRYLKFMVDKASKAHVQLYGR